MWVNNIVNTLYNCPTLVYPLHPGIIDYYGTCNYRLPRVTMGLSFFTWSRRTRPECLANRDSGCVFREGSVNMDDKRYVDE